MLPYFALSDFILNILTAFNHRTQKLRRLKKAIWAEKNDYVYRFNKRNARQWIFNDVIEKIMNQVPHPYTVLKTIWACKASSYNLK